jgi:hypothetical protein
MKRQLIEGYMDLNYVVLLDVPVRDSKFGPIIDLDPAFVEKRIAEELITQRVPLRGREIQFLRKTLGLSLEKFANSFGYSAGGVLKWERDPEKRLDALTEAGLRSWFAEKFEVKLPGKFKELVGYEKSPERVEVRTAKAA